MEKNNLLYDLISEKVKNGTWKRGDRIFSEIELAKQLGVSRNTVREALSVFIEKGAISKKVGSGSYIENVSYFKDQKYILISINDFYLNDRRGEPYRQTLYYLKNEIINRGYEPLVYMFSQEKGKPIVRFDVTEVAGVITFLGNEKIDERFIKSGIPIVSVMGCTPGIYPSSIMDYRKFYETIKDIINEYNWKDILFVSFYRNLFTKFEQGFDVYVHYAMESYFAERYKFIRCNFDYSMSDAGSVFRTALKDFDKVPDAVIFPDDIVYNACYNVFFEFDDMMSKTNIVTYSSGDVDIKGKYSPCTIGFDLNQLVKNCVDMLEEYIDKRYIGETTKLINPIITNKNVLKKKDCDLKSQSLFFILILMLLLLF